jgi:hypothetical protein
MSPPASKIFTNPSGAIAHVGFFYVAFAIVLFYSQLSRLDELLERKSTVGTRLNAIEKAISDLAWI